MQLSFSNMPLLVFIQGKGLFLGFLLLQTQQECLKKYEVKFVYG